MKINLKQYKEPRPPVMVNYCMRCGLQLKTKPLFTYFDMRSGDKSAHWIWYCPNKRFWNGHTKFRTDENGSSYSYEA